MARVKNDLLKLSGSIGDITFSQDEEGTLARQKPGKKPLKTLAEGTQKSAEEMVGAWKMARDFCHAFNIEDKIWMDHYFSGRLAGTFRKLALEDRERPAPRHLDLRRQGQVLEGFDCFRKRPLWMAVGGLYPSPEWNPERTAVHLALPPLNVKKQVSPPEGTNHISFALAVVPVSNYTYNIQRKEYQPLARVSAKAFITHSPVISLKQKTIDNQTLLLNWETPFAEEVGLVCLVGVQFYTGMNGELWKKGKTESMRVLGVG